MSARALSAADCGKLAKILGLLGSDRPGERDAAALAAHRFVQQRGIAWRDVLNSPRVEHKLPELGSWRGTCRACLARPDLLRRWERGFLEDLPKFRRLSVKQRYVLREIADRVLERAG